MMDKEEEKAILRNGIMVLGHMMDRGLKGLIIKSDDDEVDFHIISAEKAVKSYTNELESLLKKT
jgi:hypothetical protein